MSSPGSSAGEAKYYDPAEVESYISEATSTVNALQSRLADALRRAEEAERALDEKQPETASLGRALLLASSVADKTIAEAETKAEEIHNDAEVRAASIVAEAEVEARRVVEVAQAAAADIFGRSEAQLLAAVNALVDGSNVLREELAKMEGETSRDRASVGAEIFPPPITGTRRLPNTPGGIHNRLSSRNGSSQPSTKEESPVRVTPFAPPPPYIGSDIHPAKDQG
jgi:cell division septum initiation protein DivIVA